MIEFIFSPSDTGYRYTFPPMTGEISGELLDSIDGLEDSLKEFAGLVAEQFGCAGIQIYGVSFSRVLAAWE